jgi:hypothetical protein
MEIKLLEMTLSHHTIYRRRAHLPVGCLVGDPFKPVSMKRVENAPATEPTQHHQEAVFPGHKKTLSVSEHRPYVTRSD